MQISVPCSDQELTVNSMGSEIGRVRISSVRIRRVSFFNEGKSWFHYLLCVKDSVTNSNQGEARVDMWDPDTHCERLVRPSSLHTGQHLLPGIDHQHPYHPHPHWIAWKYIFKISFKQKNLFRHCEWNYEMLSAAVAKRLSTRSFQRVVRRSKPNFHPLFIFLKLQYTSRQLYTIVYCL